MADRTIDIVTAATEIDLLTLAEAKMMLGVSVADTSQDANIQFLISVYSATVAEIANRTFAEEEVIETWREIGNGRLFLSHWPVKIDNIFSLDAGSSIVVRRNKDVPGFYEAFGNYELEGQSGKLSNVGLGGMQSADWIAPVVVHYIGGYKLPEEAPLPLKQAVVMMIREERVRMIQAQTAGIRQISHKEARVSFFDPNAILLRSVGAKSPTMQAVENLVKQYMRFEV